MDDFAVKRAKMVQEQIADRGIRDKEVLRAMNTVPRENFVPARYLKYAYRDGPIPIPAKQTISQPYVVAWMAAALQLKPTDIVLEIGTGSGYAAAVLSRIAQAVYTIERHEQLVAYARERLAEIGYDNVHVQHGDGTLGWPENAPYDGIIVAAGGPVVPPTLREQMAINGRLVMPVGRRSNQKLIHLTRRSQDQYTRQVMGGVRFVPLIGAEGWRKK
jgi:protein-L-isoaspartate(D-aspartate) O-methyltransferase